MLSNFFPSGFQMFYGFVYIENALNGPLFWGNFSVYEILLEYQVILPTLHHHKWMNEHLEANLILWPKSYLPTSNEHTFINFSQSKKV